ncbi:hypothetical protein MRX96_036831 [Rhipicephalus microplus]
MSDETSRRRPPADSDQQSRRLLRGRLHKRSPRACSVEDLGQPPTRSKSRLTRRQNKREDVVFVVEATGRSSSPARQPPISHVCSLPRGAREVRLETRMFRACTLKLPRSSSEC